MPGYKQKSEGIEKLLPWSKFIREQCSGLIDVETITTENHPMLKIYKTSGNKSYTKEFKQLVVEEYLSGKDSLLNCKTPLEVRTEALSTKRPTKYLIPRNKRIEKYKAKWCT